MGVNSLPKSVIGERRGCDLNPGPSAPESSMLTTRLPSHPVFLVTAKKSVDADRRASCFARAASEVRRLSRRHRLAAVLQ